MKKIREGKIIESDMVLHFCLKAKQRSRNMKIKRGMGIWQLPQENHVKKGVENENTKILVYYSI